METTFTRIARGQRSDTAYAVYADGTFLGYVAGRDGGWSTQPEADPAVPVSPTYEFVYAYPSRAYAAGLLIEEARTAGLIPPDGDTRDPLCDDCCHAPGDHPVAAVYAYCDTKHEHEARLVTDGTVAYAAGAYTDVEGVYLAASPLATETPVGGLILAGSCGQPLRDDEPCRGDLRWTVEADDWNAATVTPEDREHLSKFQTQIEDL